MEVGISYKEAREILWSNGEVLYPDGGFGYTGIHTYPKLSGCTLKNCAFNCEFYFN